MPRHSIRTVFVSILALGVLLIPVTAPASSQGVVRSGEGTGYFTSLEETSSRQAGANRIAERVLTGVLTSGPLQGEFTERVRGVIHPTGQVTFHGTMEFTGTAEGCNDGQPGTVVARLSGTGQAGAAPVTDATFALVDRAAGSLAATGQGSVHQDGLQVSYTVQYVCH